MPAGCSRASKTPQWHFCSVTEGRQIVIALQTQVVAIARVVANMVERNERLLYSYIIGPSGKRWSAETEVRKWEEKSPISVYCIIDSRICVLRPCRPKGAQPLQCESRIFSSRTAASVTITNSAMCMWEPDPNQDKRWVHGPTMWALCSWNVLKVMQMRVLS